MLPHDDNSEGEELSDEQRLQQDEQGLKAELAEELLNGNTDDAIHRMEDLGLTTDDLDL